MVSENVNVWDYAECDACIEIDDICDYHTGFACGFDFAIGRMRVYLEQGLGVDN